MTNMQKMWSCFSNNLRLRVTALFAAWKATTPISDHLLLLVKLFTLSDNNSKMTRSCQHFYKLLCFSTTKFRKILGWKSTWKYLILCDQPDIILWSFCKISQKSKWNLLFFQLSSQDWDILTSTPFCWSSSKNTGALTHTKATGTKCKQVFHQTFSSWWMFTS